MRKNFGAKPDLYPQPVFIVAAYDENGVPNAMNAAWGGITEETEITICLSAGHKTTKNIQTSGAFTVSMATADYVKECDYLGIVSGNKVANQLDVCGFHTEKSEFVNAPIIKELPMTVECELIKFNEDGICIGEIVNVSACEKILNENGQIDVKKLDPITYDSSTHTYWRLGDAAGKAFAEGKKIK